MSWYYVGPDAKPVGPISVEELQVRRSTGVVGPDTYVIEAPAGSAPKEWRRFSELFQAAVQLPPLPTSAHLPPSSNMGIPHPVFPAVPPTTPSPGGPVFTGAHPSTYRLPGTHRTNPWCTWGFALSLASLPLMLCGFGVIVALAAAAVSVVGLVQVGHHREQQGRGLAVSGILISILSLICAAALAYAIMSSSFRNAFQMTTEQTSNDSDTR